MNSNDRFSIKRLALLLLLALIAFSVRMSFLADLAESPYATIQYTLNEDQYYLHTGALNFLEGDLLARSPVEGGNNYSPVYKYFIGMIYALFGPNYLAVYFFQMLLGSVGTILIFLIANRTIHVAGAVLASGAFALYVPEIVYEGALLRGSFLTFFAILSCFLLLRLKENLSESNLVMAILALSVFIQIRPNVILVLPFVLWFLAKEIFSNLPSEKQKRYWGFFFAILLLSFVPMLVQAYLVHGRFVFFDASGPQVLLNCNQPVYSGYGYSHLAYSSVHGKPPTQSFFDAISILFMQWTQEPMAMFQMMGRKIFFLFNDYEPSNNISSYHYRDLFRLSPYLINHFSIFSSLGLFGIMLSCMGKDKNGLTRGYALGLILAIIPICVLSRFRLPLVPFLILFSSYGIFFILQNLKAGKYFSSGVMILGVAGLFHLFQVPEDVDPIRPVDHCNRAAVWLSSDLENRFSVGEESALACLKTSESNPVLHMKARQTLGYAYYKYIEALGADPSSGQLLPMIKRGLFLTPGESGWIILLSKYYWQQERHGKLLSAMHAGRYIYPNISFFEKNLRLLEEKLSVNNEEIQLWKTLEASPDSLEAKQEIVEHYKQQPEEPYVYLLLRKWNQEGGVAKDWAKSELKEQLQYSGDWKAILRGERIQETR